MQPPFSPGPRELLHAPIPSTSHGTPGQHKRKAQILSPKFALEINVRLPSCPSANWTSGKLCRVRQSGLCVNLKNTLSLRTGAILTYWETAKDDFANNVQSYLAKETTSEKMRDIDVISITMHTSCTVQMTEIPFQSFFLLQGTTKTFRFDTNSLIGVSLPPKPLSSGKVGLEARISGENGSARSSPNTEVTNDAERLKHPISDVASSGSSSRGPAETLASGEHRRKAISAAEHRSNAQKQPNVIRSDNERSYFFRARLDANESSRLTCNPPSNQLPGLSMGPERTHHSSSASAAQKRPQCFSDVEDTHVSAKKARSDAYASHDGSSLSFQYSSKTAILHPAYQSPNIKNWRLQEALSAQRVAQSALEKEQQNSERIKRQAREGRGKLMAKFEEEVQIVRKRCERYDSEVVDLKGNLRRLGDAYEEVLQRVSDVHNALDDSDASKKILGDKLQNIEEDSRRLRQREAELSTSLQEVKVHSEASRRILEDKLQNAEEDNRRFKQREEELEAALQKAKAKLTENSVRSTVAEAEARKAKAYAETALGVAEEREQFAKTKQTIAEEAFAAERVKRVAVEQAFLDLQCVLSGVNVCLETDGAKFNNQV